MVRRLILVFCLALVACGNPATVTVTQEPDTTVVPEEPATAPATQPTEAPTTAPATEPSEEPIPWDNPYDPSTYDNPETELLCPEDGAADAQPVFGEVLTGKLEAQDVLIRRGLYVNAQNEVFRIDVTAPSTAQESAESLDQYTNELVVCFDHILLTVITDPVDETPAAASVAEPFGSNLADLAIEVYMQGHADPNISRDAVWELLAQIVEEPVEEWSAFFKETRISSPEELYPDQVKQDFQIAYIFDPWIGAGARHQYVERRANKVYVNASVRNGSGSVTAGLCRSYSLLPGGTMTVTYGGSPDTDARSDSRLTNYTYDLGVRGGSSGGRYRISGIWGMSGWYAGYWDPAPTGSWYGCNP